ncbi:MAG: hypothetical protein JSR28_04400 [Proteobacteria bacterium]|nr:hypothetical protein [Pseudomonadota bacterium]
MHRSRASLALPVAAAMLAMSGTALLAQPGPWGGRDWDRPGWERDRYGPSRGSSSAAEGRIEIARFRAEGDGAAALRSGTIAVSPMPEGAGGIDLRQDATYQAAVESELLGSGYQAAPAAGAGQVAEVRIVRNELEPAEAKHKPVSGEMSMGVSNRGSMMGLGLYIDGTKPKKALLSTMLEARIRDRASGKVLWEGRAAIATREGDDKWTDTAIATRLAHALFDGFPLRTGEESVKR